MAKSAKPAKTAKPKDLLVAALHALDKTVEYSRGQETVIDQLAQQLRVCQEFSQAQRATVSTMRADAIQVWNDANTVQQLQQLLSLLYRVLPKLAAYETAKPTSAPKKLKSRRRRE